MPKIDTAQAAAALHRTLCELWGIPLGHGAQRQIADRLEVTPARYSQALSGRSKMDPIMEWASDAGLRTVVEPDGAARFERSAEEGDPRAEARAALRVLQRFVDEA